MTPTPSSGTVELSDEGGPPGTPAEPGGVGGKREVVAWVPTLAVLLVTAPLLLLLVRGLSSGLPDFAVEGDMAVTEFAVREAAAGRRLAGPYSRFAFNHPGPLPFYVLAPGYALSGGSFSAMLVSALLLNCVAVAAVLAVVWLAAGRLATVWAALALSVYLLYLRPELLHSVWNPNLSVLPFAVVVVAAAAVGAGRTWALPVGVAAGSLALQCHVAYLVPLLAVAVVTAVFCLLPLIPTRAATRPRGRAARIAPWLLAVTTGLVLWFPVILEQTTGQPGNLTRLARFFSGAGAGQGLVASAETVAANVGGALLAPVGATAAVPEVSQSWVASVITLALLGGVVGAFVRTRRGGERFEAGLALSCVGLVGVAVVAVTRIVGTVEPYLVRWVSVLGPLMVLAVLLGWVRPRSRSGRSAAVWTALGLLVGVSAANVIAAGRFAPLGIHAAGERYRRIERLAAATAAGLDRAGVSSPRIGVFSHAVWDTAAGVALRLLKMGYAVGIDPAWYEMMGRGAAQGDWRADSGLILCRPAAVDGLAADGDVSRIGGDEHVAILLVRSPITVQEVRMASPLSVVVCSEGLYGPEAGRYRWSRGLHSTFSIPLLPGRRVDLVVDAVAAREAGREQIVGVSLNGASVGTLVMRPGQGSYRVELPGPLIGAVNDLRFDYRFFVVPGARDPRELAVRFEALRFMRGGPGDAGGLPVGD